MKNFYFISYSLLLININIYTVYNFKKAYEMYTKK
jgi:hypothetical protein